VLLNLVFNALDAMVEGGRLTLTCRADAESAYLMVGDTGPGIPRELLARIFEPFFTTKGPQRSGLGLSVSYGIVRRYRGDLTAESRPGTGTVFTVRLPLAPVGAAPPEEPAAPVPAAAGLRVLVVDDEDRVRETLRDICTDEGHHVLEARSGREALDLLAGQAVDVVCTDLGMPGMTGWQLADQIRERWPQVRVGLITGWGSSVQPDDLRTHHVDFLISKPFRRDQVLAVLVPAEKSPAR
jgi:CheY-like chemotaxis protein